VIVDRLMLWNLVGLCVGALVAHLWLVFAILRRHSSPGTFPAIVRWALVGAFCVMYAWMALTAQRLWAWSRFFIGEQFQWYFRYPGQDAVFGLVRPQLVDAAASPEGSLGRCLRSPGSTLTCTMLFLWLLFFIS
jgi:cytochrome c oxidase subunit 2